MTGVDIELFTSRQLFMLWAFAVAGLSMAFGGAGGC